jgi:DNA-binding MarR family transcriptional regulator
MPVRTPVDASPATPEPAVIASELGAVIGLLVRRLRTQRPIPLSHATVLGRLCREGPQSVSDLAQAEHVRPQSMAQTVSELESGGFVIRRPDPDDRRRAVVEVTAEGSRLRERELSRRDGWLAQAIVSELSPDEQEELLASVNLLRRLAES